MFLRCSRRTNIIKPVREALILGESGAETVSSRALRDTLSGLIVLTGTQLALSPSGFAAVNVVLVAVWLGLAFAIVRHSRAADNTATRAAA